MKKILFLAITAITILISCDDNTGILGQSMTSDVDKITSTAASYNIASKTILADSVVSRANHTYLGKVKDPETDTYIKCDFMSQVKLPASLAFSPAKFFPAIDTLIVVDDNGKEFDCEEGLDEDIKKQKCKFVKADSCSLHIVYTPYWGDSTVAMKAIVHELVEPYTEDNIYTTNYNPITEKMIREDDGSIHVQFSASLADHSNRAAASGTHFYRIPLNKEYTDQKGNKYNNYGTYLMQQYYNPDAPYYGSYRNDIAFRENICPGFFTEFTGGMDAMAKVAETVLNIYYRVRNTGSSTDSLCVTQFLGNEESIQQIHLSQEGVEKLIEDEEDADFTYIKSPAALFTKIFIPIDSIMSGHENDSLTVARVFIPRRNNVSGSTIAFSAPETVALIQSSVATQFFLDKKITDSKTSFYTTYSSTTNGYTFNNIASMIRTLYNSADGERWRGYCNDYADKGATEDERRIRRNAFNSQDKDTLGGSGMINPYALTLVPVEITTNTVNSATVIGKVANSMELASSKLAKGSFDNKNIIISVIYSKFDAVY